MVEKTELTNVKVVLISGKSKKGKDYNMIVLETGDTDLDYSLKPIFLSSLEYRALIDVETKK